MRTVLQIVLPLLRPAVIAGAGLAFITMLGDFVTSIVLYTYDTRPISIEIQSSLRIQETGIAAAYGVLLMVLSAAAFIAWDDRAGAALRCRAWPAVSCRPRAAALLPSTLAVAVWAPPAFRA